MEVKLPCFEDVNSAPSNIEVNNEENHSSAVAMPLWLLQGLYLHTLKDNLCIQGVSRL